MLLPLVSDSAKFNDSFNSRRPARVAAVQRRQRARIEPMVEVFNLFNVDEHPRRLEPELLRLRQRAGARSSEPGTPGFLTSSAVRQAGDDGRRSVRHRGGPRAFQLAARVTF